MLTQELDKHIEDVLTNISEIKFYITRYLETKDILCIKRALSEINSIRSNLLKILINNKGDKKVEDVFEELLRTIVETEDIINDLFKGNL